MVFDVSEKTALSDTELIIFKKNKLLVSKKKKYSFTDADQRMKL